MENKVTIEDVARLAHVSRATVSRVLNEHPNISDDVRKRVLKVMEETGYRPNTVARSLAGKRSTNIGVAVFGLHPNYLAHGVFQEAIMGIQEVLTDSDYDLLLYSSHGHADDKFCRQILAKAQVDGLVVMGELVAPEHLQVLIGGGLPVVTVGRKDGPPVPYVSVDNIRGAHLAAEHLIRLGHRRIGIIRGVPGLQPGVDRLMGYQRALEGNGIAYDPTLVVVGVDKVQGRAAMEQLLSLPEPPTAVFGISDPATIGAMEYAQERGFRVPDDVAFVGFDDIQAAGMVSPALTTVRQPKAELGRQAARVLLGMIGGQTMAGGILLDPELIERDSCGAKTSYRG
ncbi:MAG TPA: LacI family DNA-binding transcriptional regulator [Symbiobacteriaceae bacterium]|nr:LacI family DNA-binding transcriptional regulator [Symbiobacteriaceae bacterium]